MWLFLFPVLLLAPCSFAQSIWNGGGTDNNWSTGANWQDGVTPVSDVSTAIQFGGTTRLTPSANAAWTIGSLTFNSGASAFTLSGSALTLAAGGAVTNNSTNLQTISNSGGLVLSGASTWNTASGNLTASSVLSGSGGSVTKTGSGTLTLSGANTFAGGVTLNTGTLTLGNASALGTGRLTINGGTLSATTTASTLTLSTNNAQTWAGDFTFALTSSKSLNLGTGAVTLGASRTVTVNGNTLTVGGAIGDGGSGYALTKAGAGTLTLSGASTYTGGTIVSAGTLSLGASNRLADAGALTVSGGTFSLGGFSETVGAISLQSGTISSSSGTLSGSSYDLQSGTVSAKLGGAGMLTKSTSGTVTLTGANTFTGGVTLSAGTLTLGNASALGTGRLTLNGGTLDVSTGLTLAANNAQTWNGSFTYAATGNNSLNLGTGAVTLGGNTTVTTNGSNFIVGGGTVLTVGGGISDGGNGYGLTKAGPTRLLLNGVNTYTGATTIAGGLLQFGKEASLYNGNTALWDSSHLIVQSGGTAIFNVGGAGQFTSTDIAALQSLGTATGGFLSGSAIGFDVSGAPGQTFTYSSPIANPNGGTNALGVFKQGDGTLVLSGANTYTGPTTITRGALQIPQRSSLYGGDSSRWTASNLVVLGGSLRLSVGGAGEFTASDVATIAALGTSTGGFQTGSRLDLDTTNAVGGTFDFSGTIANTNSGANHLLLGKTGSGTLVLSGNSPGFNVDATIRGGTVSIPTGARIGLNAANAATWTVGESTGDNGAIQVAGTLYSNVKLGVAGTGALTVQNGGLVNGVYITVGDEANGGTGTLTVGSGGQVVLTDTLVINRGTVNIQSGGVVSLARTLLMDANIPFQQVVNVTGPGAKLLISAAGAGPYLSMWGGTLNVSGGGYVEAFTVDWDNGKVTISGPGSLMQTSHLILTATTGSLTIDNGGAVAGPNGSPTGTEARVWGALNIGSSDLAHPTTAGTFGLATIDLGTGSVINFNQTDATVFTASITDVGKVAQRGTGTTTLTGTNTYSGGTTISGGTLVVSANANFGAATGKVTFGGGILRTTADFIAARVTTLNAGGGTFDVASGTTLTWNGAISGAAGNALTKTGTGTLTLGGANPFAGPTAINAGTLKLASGATLSGTSSITVASGATFDVSADGFTLGSGKTLGGSGSVAGLLTVGSGGHLSPGSSPGTLTFLNGLTLAAGSALDFELGAASDLIRVSGGTLTGPTSGLITLNLSDAGGFAAGTYTLFDFTGATKSDFDLSDFGFGTTLPGYTYSLAFDGSMLELTATSGGSAIPEPSTYAAIFGACALGLATWRRRVRV